MDFTGLTSGYRSLLPRAEFNVDRAVEIVRPILEDVAQRGETALKEYAELFDGVLPEHVRVPSNVIAEAEQQLAAEFGIRSIPSILFVPMGEAPQMAQGALPKDAFKQAIDEVLLKKS